MAYNFLSLLVFLALLGAGYALLAPRVRHRFGNPGLAVLLLITSLALSALAVTRIARVSAAFPYRPAVDHPLWMGGLLAGWLLLSLLPLTLRAASSRTSSDRRPLAIAIAGVPWIFLGFFIALVVLLILDIAGVPFLPPATGPVDAV